MYTYLGKALAAISRDPNKADIAAKLIGQMPKGDISKLNDQLNLGWVSYATWDVATVQGAGGNQKGVAADLKRGAMLLQILTRVPVTADFENANNIIRNVVLSPPAGAGYYLKPSALAFASQQECDIIKSSWSEAVDMLSNARITAGAARYANDKACKEIFTKWFGKNDPLAVVQTIERTIAGVLTKQCGVCYQGARVATMGNWAIKLVEKAHLTSASEVIHNTAEFGWSAPLGANDEAIGFTDQFFNETLFRRLGPHDVNSTEMGVTRAGAMVHELTHRFARTADTHVGPSVAGRIALIMKNKGRGQTVSPTLKAYSPLVCWALAEAAPDLALNNADNYRLFCEDAYYFKPFG